MAGQGLDVRIKPEKLVVAFSKHAAVGPMFMLVNNFSTYTDCRSSLLHPCNYRWEFVERTSV